MDDQTLILLEAEEAWSTSRCHGTYYLSPEEYRFIRDTFKAHWIYEHYGYEHFLQFVNRCPHIQDLIKDYSPCKKAQDSQCSIYCYYYTNGGCKNATE